MSWCYLSFKTQDIVQLANEVADVYSDNLYGNPWHPHLPVHTLLLPNGNLEDTLDFIKWNMEERLVAFLVICKNESSFQARGPLGLLRDARLEEVYSLSYLSKPTQTNLTQPIPGTGLISPLSSCLVGSTSWWSGGALGLAPPESKVKFELQLDLKMPFDEKALVLVTELMLKLGQQKH